MGSIKGVNIVRGKVGTNRLGSDDAISGIIITTPIVSGLEHNTPAVVYNLKDVEALGITKELDESENINVWEHFKEFYRVAGEGTELHFVFMKSTESISLVLGPRAMTFLLRAGGRIKQLAVAFNYGDTEISTIDGLNSKVFAAISEAKALEKWLEGVFMPVHIFIEGNHYEGPANVVPDLRGLSSGLHAEGVSVVIGQDYEVAASKTEKAQRYAFVGTVLGATAASRVERNIGENETMNLTDAARGELVVAGLSSHETIQEKYSDLQTLNDKGYIFGITYTGLAGVRINDDHVCAPVILDADNSINEHTIAFGRVGKKARRELRKAYLPKVKTTWEVDEKTGKLSPGTIVALEAIGDQVFADMKKRGEITAGEVTVDPESDLIVEKILRVSYKIVPKGSISEISGVVNLKTQL